MAHAIFDAPHFHSEEAAFAYVEKLLWPQGPVCPHCGGMERAYDLSKTRLGLRKCGHCRKQFTVRIGTIFEESHLALRYWLQAIHLMASSKKGISTRQMQRLLNCSMKTAWFLTHRIREIMGDRDTSPMGGSGPVQVDETYFGTKDEYRGQSKRRKKGHSKKMAVVSLIDAEGQSRTFHIDRADAWTIRDILRRHVAPGSTIHTDESALYRGAKSLGLTRKSVRHASGIYVTSEGVTTNTVEGFFSVFKRGMRGVYQQCSEKHLHRYLAEFDFRYSNREALGIDDAARADVALAGAKGKRLTYRTVNR